MSMTILNEKEIPLKMEVVNIKVQIPNYQSHIVICLCFCLSSKNSFKHAFISCVRKQYGDSSSRCPSLTLTLKLRYIYLGLQFKKSPMRSNHEYWLP